MELTTAQAAKRLGISQPRVRQMIRTGRIKARLFAPRLLLIDEKELVKPSVKNRKPGRPWPKIKGKVAVK
jgi:excisionase family DNA binding protein